MLDLPVVRLDPELPLPAYARPGDAGADLVAREGVVLAAGGGRALVPTGVAVAIPEGYAGLVLPRSGLAAAPRRHRPERPRAGRRRLPRRAERLLVNTDPPPTTRCTGATGSPSWSSWPWSRRRSTVVDELPASERGEGGFGHSGR